MILWINKNIKKHIFNVLVAVKLMKNSFDEGIILQEMLKKIIMNYPNCSLKALFLGIFRGSLAASL